LAQDARGRRPVVHSAEWQDTMTALRPRLRAPAALCALLACGLGLCSLSFNFLAAFTGVAKASFPSVGPEAHRGDAEPRTVMHGKWPDRTRPHGGGKHVFRMNRKPVLGYAVAEVQNKDKIIEPAASVLRRMRAMVDTEHVFMAAERQRYFRPKEINRKWTADYNMRMGRRKKLRKVKDRFEEAWQQWLRTEGRSQGLTEPVKFEGPKLGHWMTEELDEASDPKVMLKSLPSKQDMKSMKENKKKWGKLIPQDIMPGQWNDEGEDNIFKIWKRPMHKQPYDIGKRGSNHVVRGQVF